MPIDENDEPKLGFQTPPGWQVPTGVVVSLPPPSPRPTIPHPVFPNDGPLDPFKEVPDWFDTQSKKISSYETHKQYLERIKKAKSAASRNLFGAAFAVGWEIGDYLFPNGWYSFGSTVPPSPETDGWSHPGYSYVPCNDETVCDLSGATLFKLHFTQPGVSNGPDCGPLVTCTGLGSHPVSTGHATPLAAEQAAVGISPINVGQRLSPTSGNWFRHGQLVHDGVTPYDPADWVQLAPSTGSAPLTGPFASEDPMSFPMEWPVHHPTATPWKDAAPAPGEQSPPLARGGGVPAMPLAPFPVVVAVPPAGGNLPPPTQVITVPSPGGGGGPPTIHTRPASGNAPPRGKTKEKKLSVRSKANKAWIVLNLATEVFDFIDALFKGLPADVRKGIGASIDYGREGGGRADPYSKLKAVWDHWDQMEWDDAMQAFINNQIEDMVVGGIGAAASHANKVSGAATGGGGAVSGRPQRFAQDAQEADAAAEGQDKPADELPIPTVEYNSETGRWEVTVPLSKAGLGDDLTFR